MKAEKAKTTKVVKVNTMTRKELLFYTIVVGFGVGAIAVYAQWWFQAAHIATNGATFWSINLLLFIMLSFVVWLGIFQRLAIWFLVFNMKKPIHLEPEKNQKVAMLTCFVPGKEPYELLEKTLRAMVAIKYPHDSWVLDEGNDPVVIAMCERLGVKHFSRAGIEKYNQESGPFKSKTKAGNHNAWRDKHEEGYDLIAQMDMDHIPQKNYLDKVLGYFRDPEVAFVLAPQVYEKAGWIATGAGEQAYIFNGPMQMGFYGHDMPLFIGTNHAYRPEAMNDIGGYAATIVEDHLTGMHFFAKGWKGVYLSEVVAIGEGPGNWVEYFNQQMRWAYGIFEVLFRHSPKLLPKMSWPKRFNYVAAQTYYLVGVAMMIGVFLTCLYLIFGYSSASFDFWGWVKHAFPPFAIAIFLQFWVQRFYVSPWDEKGIGWRGMLLSLGAMPIYAVAFFKAVTRQKLQYAVTAKGSSAGSSIVPLKVFTPHLLIIGLSIFGLVMSYIRGNDAPQLRIWAAINVVLFSIVVLSSRELNFNFGTVLRPRQFSVLRAAAIAAVVLIFVVSSPVFSTNVLAPAIVNNNFIRPASAESKKITTEDNKIYLGMSGGDVWNQLPSIESSINKKVMIVGKYQPWGDTGANFDTDLMERLSQKNYIPLITWEPWNPNYTGEAYDQPEYKLSNIVAGNFDSYIHQYAIDVKKFDKPVVIRFAHEMNGNWYPWGAGVNGNTPADYRAAWIHVYDIFEQNEVKNVTWVWSPNEVFTDVDAPYAQSYDELYPGDQYVDWVAFSAYNWGRVNAVQKWRSFDQIVEPSYNLIEKYNKPIMISEINTSTRGGDKEAWMQDMNFQILKYPKIKAVVWFETPGRDLFQIDTHAEAYTSF